MRGFPPLHLILFALGFALLAVPLSRLTFARPTVSREAPASRVAVATVPTMVRVRVAHVPESLSLKLEGRELVVAGGTRPDDGEMEFQENLSIPAEGLEFVLSARWPTGTPATAITVELEPDGLDAQSQTRWSSDAQIEGVITYHWKP